VEPAITGKDRETDGVEPPSATELVFASCHEVGNWLAGVRLEANLVDSASDPAEFASAARRIESASARAGSLLALIRPLLDPSGMEARSVDPLDVLAGLRSGLDENVDARVSVDLKSAVELPPCCLPAEPLHHLLGSAIYYGLEAAGETGRVCVRASVENGWVEFAVLDGGALPEAEASPALRGRPLLLAVARKLMGPMNARADLRAHPDGTRWVVAFPDAVA